MKLLKSLRNHRIIFYIVIFILFFSYFITINNSIMDNYWNYGFGYNIAKGLIPYRDFNMLQFPLSSFLLALIMKILGSKLIIYYLYCSFINTLIIYFLDELHDEKAIGISLYFMLFFGVGGYDALSLLLFLVILYLEEKKIDDYLMGIMLGMAILAKQYLVVLVIPTLLLKDKNKKWRRLVGVIIPLQILAFYLVLNNAFADFIDYTILGIFDFGHKNTNLNFLFFLELIIVILLMHLYKKNRDGKLLYVLCFQVMAIPIFDLYHVYLALFPFFSYIFKVNNKLFKIINYAFIILLFIMVIDDISEFSSYFKHHVRDCKNNFYMTEEFVEPPEIVSIYERAKDSQDEIHFIYSNSYYYKLKYDVKIDKFDMILYGNNGYNGNEKLKKRIKGMKHALFVVEDREKDNKYDQINLEIVDFIKDNYEMVDELGYDLYVYEIVN